MSRTYYIGTLECMVSDVMFYNDTISVIKALFLPDYEKFGATGYPVGSNWVDSYESIIEHYDSILMNKYIPEYLKSMEKLCGNTLEPVYLKDSKGKVLLKYNLYAALQYFDNMRLSLGARYFVYFKSDTSMYLTVTVCYTEGRHEEYKLYGMSEKGVQYFLKYFEVDQERVRKGLSTNSSYSDKPNKIYYVPSVFKLANYSVQDYFAED